MNAMMINVNDAKVLTVKAALKASSDPVKYIINKEKKTVVCKKNKNLFELCDEIVWNLVKQVERNQGFSGSTDEVADQMDNLYDYLWDIAWKSLWNRYGNIIHSNDEDQCYNIYIPFTGKAKLSKEDEDDGVIWNEETGKEFALFKCDNLVHRAKERVYSDISVVIKDVKKAASSLKKAHKNWNI